jgi:transporter family-2 protein
MEFAATLVGMTIAVMLVINASLQQALGPTGALVAVHVVGLVAIIPLALLVKSPRTPGRIPFVLFTAGLVGVALLWINNRTIPVLGAGLAVALGVVGQLTASAAVDHWGLFGLPRRPFRPKKLVGILLTMAGVAVMTVGGTR